MGEGIHVVAGLVPAVRLGHQLGLHDRTSAALLQALRSVASLLVGAGILILGNSLIGIVVPIRLNLEGVATELSGLVMSAYYAGFVAGSFWGKGIIARVGHIRAFAAFAGLLAAATLIFPLWVISTCGTSAAIRLNAASPLSASTTR